jgi:DNA-binding NarL/FixJ family response regulator
MRNPKNRIHTRKKILVADDSPEMLDAVERCLQFDCDVVERVGNGLALVEGVCRLQPDLFVADISMPGLSGLDALRRLRDLNIQIPAVIITVEADEDFATEAFAAGAQGFVLKSRLERDLRFAVQQVLAGRTFRSHPAIERSSARNDGRRAILLNQSGLLISRTEALNWPCRSG